MRYVSAQYILTGTGEVLKRAVLALAPDGTIAEIIASGPDHGEKHSVEFYNGIILPGFVNCHCHLELSHMHNAMPKGGGLGAFIFGLRDLRAAEPLEISEKAAKADEEMFAAGISACADICNTPHTFPVKAASTIRYINLLEVFGIDSEKAAKRMDELRALASKAASAGAGFQLVPHAPYSMSLSLLGMLLAETSSNSVTSIHFMETAGERMFLESLTGPLYESYLRSGLLPARTDLAPDPVSAVLDYVTPSGNLILVHNTFADSESIQRLKSRKNLFFCLCPGANLFIEERMPPLTLLLEEGCDIVIGTDSLASNSTLSIFEEMKLLQQHFPFLNLKQLSLWASANGARALGLTGSHGVIAPGSSPGLVLVNNADLENLKLLPGSTMKRLA
jgi:cytosine/adenosine deaminase-related metal-dependent hydrolase